QAGGRGDERELLARPGARHRPRLPAPGRERRGIRADRRPGPAPGCRGRQAALRGESGRLMAHFVPHTDAEIEAMLGFLGLGSLDELFAHIPAAVRLAGGLDVAPGRAEADVLEVIGEFAGRNRSTGDLVCFAGGGAYEHELPAAVRALGSRSELVTSYTPYQPELAQGVLQALFEYQTMLCRITGMDVANASLYDEAGAAERAHAAGALLVAAADPVAAGLLRPVGSLGADVAVGEGQPFGTPLSFGGPYVGLFAVKQAPWVRRWLPGRLVGETTDT